MRILNQPSSVSFSGNIEPFRLSSGVDVTFVLKDGAAVVLEQVFSPDGDDIIEIDLRPMVEDLLSFVFRDIAEAYEQPSIMKTLTAVIDGDEVDFTVIRGGIDHPSDTAANFMRSRFLTWQPNVKEVTYSSPEFLTYYADSSCTVKVKAYFTDHGGEVTDEQTATLATLGGGSVWTIPTQYAVVAGLFGSSLPAWYDVWVESGGTRLSEIQRYVADLPKSLDEDWVLFENSLGGIDSFRAYGPMEIAFRHEHQVAEKGDVAAEYRIDTERSYRKGTGSLSRRESAWLQDFFPSLGKYIYARGEVRRIVVTDSQASGQFRRVPVSFSFTFRFAESRPLLNLPVTDIPQQMLDIVVPDLGSFSLPPRLVEFPGLPLSEGVLFPVQSPHDEEWSVTSAGAMADFLRSLIHIPSPGLNRAELFQVLGGTPRTGERINPAFIDLSGYLTDSVLGHYATLADLIRSVDGKLDTEFFARVFTVYDEDGNPIVPNTYEQAADNLQVMVGLWTEKYLSALGHNEEEGEGGGTGILDLQQLWEELGSNPWDAKVIHSDHIPGLDASKIIRGVFNQERIPQLPISKITGLQDTLDGLQEALDGKLDTEFFSSVFTVYDEDGHAITPNTYEQVADNLRVLVGTWTNEYLSALGCNDEGGGTGILDKKELWEELGSSPWTDKVISDIHIPQLGIPKVEGLQNTLNTFALKTRRIATGNGLQGGGDLQADRTLSVKLRTVSSSTDNSGLKFTTDGSLYVYVEDSLTSTNQYRPLSAKQGKLLADRIAVLESLFEVDANGDVKTRDYEVNGVTKKRGLYSESFISALGANGAAGGGTGVEMVDVWRYLHGTSDDPNHVINAEHIPAMSTLSWSYGSVAGSSGSTYNGKAQKSFVIPKQLSHIGQAITEAELNAASPTSNARYVTPSVLATWLSNKGFGKGTVKKIKAGSSGSEKTPDSNGLVTLDAYPTLVDLIGNTAKGNATKPIYWTGSAFAEGTAIGTAAYKSVVTSIGSNPSDSNIPTEKAVSTALSSALGDYYTKTEVNAFTWWGQSISNGVVSGNMTNVGTISANGNITVTKTGGASIINITNANGAVEMLTDTNRGIYDRTTTTWLIATNGTNTWLSRGNVGIGTSAPDSKLHVSGSLKATTVTISSTSGVAHLNFSRANYNYITAPAGGTFSFSFGDTVGASYSVAIINSAGLSIVNDKTLKIGDAVLSYDSIAKCLKISDGTANNTTKIGIYATGTVSALGANTSGGGGTGIEMDDVWDALRTADNDNTHVIDASHLKFSSSGTGNGVANVAITNGALTVTKTNFLPLSGGKMEGALTWKNSTALPHKTETPQYFLVIEPFKDDGTTKYVTLAELKTAIGTGDYLPLTGGTISNTSFAPLKIERKNTANAAGIGFYNSNGLLGYIGMTGTANGGLIRWNSNGSTSYPILDSSNYTTYAAKASYFTNDILKIANGGTGSATTSPHFVFIGASSGTAASAPSFRVLDAADIPSLPASKIGSGTLDAARLPDLSGTYLPLNGSSKMTGSLKTVRKNGMWIIGKTEAAIMYNGGTPLADASTSEWLFNMVSSSGNTIGFGGLKDTIGFYGWLSDRTANGTDWSTSFDMNSGVLTISSLGSGSNLVLSKSSTTSKDYPAQITFNPIDSTTGYQTGVAQCYIRAYNNHSSPSGTATNGANMVIRSGGNIFIGGGEATQNHYDEIKEAATNLTKEYTFITSDNNIYLQSFTSTDGIAGRKGFVVTQNGNLIPCLVDAYNASATNSIGSSAYPFYALYASNSVKIGNCRISWDSTNSMLKFSTGIYSEGTVSALGANNNSSGGGGADIVDVWDALARPDSSKLIDSSHINISVSGSGNAVTGITPSGTSITLNKGTSFLPLTAGSGNPLSGHLYISSGYGVYLNSSDALSRSSDSVRLNYGLRSTSGASTVIYGGTNGSISALIGTSAKLSIYSAQIQFSGLTFKDSISADTSGSYILTTNGAGSGEVKYITKDNLKTALGMVEPVTALGTSGNYLTWTKGDDTNNITIPYATKATKDESGNTLTKYKGWSTAFTNDGTSGWYTVLSYSNNYLYKSAILHITTRRNNAVILIEFYNLNTPRITCLGYYGNAASATYGGFTGNLRIIKTENSSGDKYNAIVQAQFYNPTNTIASYKYCGLYGEYQSAYWSLPTTMVKDTTYAADDEDILGSWTFTAGTMASNSTYPLVNATYSLGTTAMSWLDIYGRYLRATVTNGSNNYYASIVAASTFAANRTYTIPYVADGEFVISSGDQKITGVKTFDLNTLIVNGGEAADENTNYSTIQFSTLGDSTFYNANDTAVYSTLSALRNSIRFNWYSSTWAIGNVRSGDTNSAGFAIGLMNSGKTHVCHRFLINTSGNVSISGSVTAGSEVTASSDERLKTINGDTSLTIKDIAKAPAIKFLWNDKRDEMVHIGSIAQYWEKALPEAVSYDGNGIMSLNYGALALVSAITIARGLMKHDDEITKLKRENKELKERISALERRAA